MGALKGGRAETLIEKISEIGAFALQPLLTQRSPSIGTSPFIDKVHICLDENLQKYACLSSNALQNRSGDFVI